MADRELGSDVGERVARRLAGERGASRQTRVHLDDVILKDETFLSVKNESQKCQ